MLYFQENPCQRFIIAGTATVWKTDESKRSVRLMEVIKQKLVKWYKVSPDAQFCSNCVNVICAQNPGSEQRKAYFIRADEITSLGEHGSINTCIFRIMQTKAVLARRKA